MTSMFDTVVPGPPIEVLEMRRRFEQDPSRDKINLTVGGYKVQYSYCRDGSINYTLLCTGRGGTAMAATRRQRCR